MVFSIHPGQVRTPMNEALLASSEMLRWLPGFERTFKEGRDMPIERPVRLVLRLASGEADALTGHFIDAGDDLSELLARSAEITRDDRYTLRLRR